MSETNDMELLREYVDAGSESAFTQIVQRHIHLVYSVALRFTGNSEDAQDITQAVFVILARKAARLRQKTILAGWLYETTRFTAMNFLTQKTRRQVREQEAYMQSTLNDTEPENIWPELAPLLEGAMARLSETERALVALRFFENKSIAETAALAGMNEWAARKRVDRTMEKLRAHFSKCGIHSTPATIAGAISANSMQVAPPALIKTTTAVALAKGATASTATIETAKGALKIMAWTKTKSVMVVGVGILLAVGTGTTGTALLTQHHRPHVQLLTNFPRSSWTNAGYADPTSALKTIFWAQSQGDGKGYLAGMTPDLQQRLQQQFAGQLSTQGISLAELFTQKSKQHISSVTGFYIWGQRSVSNQLLLRVWIPGGRDSWTPPANGKNATFKMKKNGNEWKLDEEFYPDY